MVNMRAMLLAALRRDPELLPSVRRSLRGKIDEDGAMSTVVHAAEALEPVIEDAVRRRPSKLRSLGLRSANLLASLASEDERSNRRLAQIAKNSVVGIVFIDIANFTKLTATHGDAFAIDLLEDLEQLIVRKIRPLKGECVKRLGDGFLLAFPSASQAVRGAVAVNDGVEKQRRRDPTFDLRLRVAVHSGEPLIEEDDLLGHDVNLTARLLEHCNPGAIVVSEAARELAGRRLKSVHFDRRRMVKIRGLATRIPVYGVRSVDHRSSNS